MPAGAAATGGGQRRIGNQREAVERERVKPHVGPHGQLVRRHEAQRAFPFTVGGEGAQGSADFGGLHPAREAQGAEVMSMQALGEASQHRLPGIGGDAFDDQLVARHTQGDSLAFFQQPVGAADDAFRRRLE